MVVDMRYHLASLVGVFFALGLGILIGTSLSSDGRLLKEQVSMIDTIEEQLNQLRGESIKLKANLNTVNEKLATYQRFSDHVLPKLVSGRLKGYSLAVVGLGECESIGDIENLLKQAGAIITGVVKVREAPSAQSSILSKQGQPDPSVIRTLAAALLQEKNADTNLIGILDWVRPNNAKADWIVLVGEDQDGLRYIASMLHQHGLSVMTTLMGSATVHPLRMTGVAAVDNGSTPLGKLQLVEQLDVSLAAKSVTGGS